MDTDMNLPLDGLWLPLVTPLRDGCLDIPAIQELAQYYKNSGVSGLVLFGSTGEGNLISMKEKFDAFHAVRDAALHVPIIIGVGGADPHAVYQSIREQEQLQPDGWLVPPPYYLRPAPEGILWHYRQVARATERPVVIYNVPKRTGVALTIELMEYLCESLNCVAVKECDPAVLSAINSRRAMISLCGEDSMFLDHFLQGGDGAIAASAHIRPDIFIAIMKLAKAGRGKAAKSLFAPLQEVIRLLYTEPNPSSFKKILSLTGYISNELRLPMTPASEELGQKLLEAMERMPSEHEVRRIMIES